MRARWVVLLVVASNLIALGIVFGYRWHDDTYRFDVAKWHAHLPGDCNDEHRQQMVGDLADRYIKAGMTKAEVFWLLGKPDYSERDAQGPVLGWDTGVIVSDCTFFYVRFGPRGRQVVDWHDVYGEPD